MCNTWSTKHAHFIRHNKAYHNNKKKKKVYIVTCVKTYMRQTWWIYSHVSHTVVSNCNLFLWSNYVGDGKASVANDPVIKKPSKLQHTIMLGPKKNKNAKRVIYQLFHLNQVALLSSFVYLPLIPSMTWHSNQFGKKNEPPETVSCDRALP